ncbi:hypothetical protein D9M71_606940 [compost metagenome]
MLLRRSVIAASRLLNRASSGPLKPCRRVRNARRNNRWALRRCSTVLPSGTAKGAPIPSMNTMLSIVRFMAAKIDATPVPMEWPSTEKRFQPRHSTRAFISSACSHR